MSSSSYPKLARAAVDFDEFVLFSTVSLLSENGDSGKQE